MILVPMHFFSKRLLACTTHLPIPITSTFSNFEYRRIISIKKKSLKYKIHMLCIIYGVLMVVHSGAENASINNHVCSVSQYNIMRPNNRLTIIYYIMIIQQTFYRLVRLLIFQFGASGSRYVVLTKNNFSINLEMQQMAISFFSLCPI